MVKSIFIGGTGTDIGKTYVTCMLLRQLQDEGFKVRAIKPVISGFDEQDIENSDSGLLLQAMGLEPSLKNAGKISPWRYPEPLPPHLAAQRGGQQIILDQIVSFCQKQAEDTLDYLLIEGVGGIMTPLNYEYTTLDLIKQLGCHCLLVTGSSLGTLSHTLSAISCINQHGIALDGLVISESLLNYTKFLEIFNDFTKIMPNISLRKISRNNGTEKIISLIT